MKDLKREIEALLFSSGREMTASEISEILKAKEPEVKEALLLLKEEYDNRDTSTSIVNEGTKWKMNVKEKYVNVVQKIITETELSKALMETLAVIAFKYPIKQSDLINIRSNKAYDHLKELEELGYIVRQRFGRTKLIKLSPKFFEYFDLPPEKLKEKFKDFESIANAIKEKEDIAKEIKEKDKEKNKEESEKGIEEINTYVSDDEEQAPSGTMTPYGDDENKLGDLEVVDVPKEDESKSAVDEIADDLESSIKKQDMYTEEEYEPVPDEEFEGGKAIEVNDAMKQKIDKRVDEIMTPGKEIGKGEDSADDDTQEDDQKKEEDV